MWLTVAIVFVVLFLLIVGYVSTSRWMTARWKVFCSGEEGKVRAINLMGNGKLYCLHYSNDTEPDVTICTKYATINQCKSVLGEPVGAQQNESDGGDRDWRALAQSDSNAVSWMELGSLPRFADPLGGSTIM